MSTCGKGHDYALHDTKRWKNGCALCDFEQLQEDVMQFNRDLRKLLSLPEESDALAILAAIQKLVRLHNRENTDGHSLKE